ncbi:hypothetical protein ROBYS_17510 [Roseobacter sp. OBYS 0001]|uniref:NnrT protein n=2 Tax=Roseobacteraceae TaxID=2854170 RepID=F7ZJ24_ROSLO|nr:hypothetical protein RLO149_c031280 [Roseobacter litoralis Och 149]GIT86735.1 hypothetical protein ROBYS_17510 [Roseobacter sp. OBYS 0001]
MRMSDDRPWPVWKLALLMYPFAAGAVAINLFMLSLMAPVVGLDTLNPLTALKLSVVLGVPAAWAAGRWARHLMDEADEGT